MRNMREREREREREFKVGKFIFLAVFCFCCCVPLAAAFNGIAIVSPYLNIDTSPTVNNIGSWTDPDPDWWETSQDRLLRYNERPSLLSLGFDMNTEHVNIVAFIEIREDVGNFLTKNSYSNIPYVGNTISAITDMNFPRLGYVDVQLGGFYGSIGRRQIKWGPATYDLAISDSAPYLDNIWLQYKTDVSYGSWWYNFIAVGFSNVALNDDEERTELSKTLFAHRLGFENSFIRVGIGELNMVYNTAPSILDFTPIGIWHNLYQDEHSNVMLHLSVEGLAGPVRMFGVFAMDDIDLPVEPASNQKPAAMGFSGGVEWQVFEGPKLESVRFQPSDYLLAEPTFRKDGGLHVGSEVFYTTNYMYNRRTEAYGQNDEVGKFTVPIRMQSFVGGYTSSADAYFVGFPYGPGSLLARLYTDYEASNWTLSGSVEWLRRGTARIEDKYSTIPNLMETWFALKAPYTDVVMVEVDGGWYPKPSIKVSAGLAGIFDITHGKNVFQCSLGAAIDLTRAFR